jgi:hypothetical protein
MPKLGTYGSVRGVPGNRPYRDRRQSAPIMMSVSTASCWRNSVQRRLSWLDLDCGIAEISSTLVSL